MAIRFRGRDSAIRHSYALRAVFRLAVDFSPRADAGRNASCSRRRDFAGLGRNLRTDSTVFGRGFGTKTTGQPS